MSRNISTLTLGHRVRRIPTLTVRERKDTNIVPSMVPIICYKVLSYLEISGYSLLVVTRIRRSRLEPVRRTSDSLFNRLDGHGGGLLLDIFNVSNHVESTLWEFIVVSVDDLLETLDGLL
jgi:hypothetical protein